MLNHKQNNNVCTEPYKVMTASAAGQLSNIEILMAFAQLAEKMKTQDPENPDLWVVTIGKHKLWGILDRGAGPNGMDLLTLLFPEDY